MKTTLYFAFILLTIILIQVGCSKDPIPIDLKDFEAEKCQSINNTSGVDLFFMLVNDDNQLIDSFRIGENVSFKYYLRNNTDNELTYMEPCSELLSLLNVYKKNPFQENQYNFIGRPSFVCVAMAKFTKLKAKTAIELGNISIKSDIKWPEMNPGSYYVGDSILLVVNDLKYIYTKRIYFNIY